MLLFSCVQTFAGNQPGANLTPMISAFCSPSFANHFNTLESERLKDVILLYPPGGQYIIRNTGQECMITGYDSDSQDGDVSLTVVVRDTGCVAVLFPEEVWPEPTIGH